MWFFSCLCFTAGAGCKLYLCCNPTTYPLTLLVQCSRPHKAGLRAGRLVWVLEPGAVFGLGFRSQVHRPLCSAATLRRLHGPGPVSDINFAECATKQILDSARAIDPLQSGKFSWYLPLFGHITNHLLATQPSRLRRSGNLVAT